MGYEDHEVLLKHVCKFCNKSFHCGRSLGGHMRSHMVNTTDGETSRKKLPALIVSNSTTNNSNSNVNLDIGNQNVNYVLRNNPKKTSKFSEDLVDTLLPKVCKECGKSFQSWKALFGHMKCHSSSSSQEEDSWNSVSESDTEAAAAAAAAASNKKKRSSRKRYNIAPAATSSSLTVAANGSSPCVSEIENEQEEIAMSLIMLSRDVSNWVGHNHVTDQCSDNNTQFLTKSELIKKVKNGKTEQGESSKSLTNGQKRNKSELLIHRDDDKKKKKIKVENEKRVISDPKIKFECTTCNKSFHSYQALGGHRASHKNSKGETCTGTHIDHVKQINSASNNENEFGQNCGSKKQLKMHECPICYKIFPSGQALGGHKRSHLIAEAKKNINNNNNHKQSVAVQKPIPEIKNFLDLNLPAPVEEEDNILESSTTHEQHIEFQQWWIDSTHKHEQLLGFLSN